MAIQVGDYWSYKIVPTAGARSNAADVAREITSSDADISYPSLVAVVGQLFLGFAAPGTPINSVSLPKLKYVISGNLNVEMSGSPLTELEFLALEVVGGILALTGADVQRDLLSFPALRMADQLSFELLKVTTLSMPALKTVMGSIGGSACTLTSLSWPLLAKVQGSLIFENCPALATVSLPAFVFDDQQTVDFLSCALSEASVDHVLARAVASDVTECTIWLDGVGNAPPSATGLADKATLVGQGNFVDTN